MFELHILTQGEVTDRLVQEQDVVRLGRDQSLDVWLPDPTLSKHHATIQLEAGAYVLHDHSTNGTFVNDQRVTVRPLNDGDRIRLGTYHLRFVYALPLWMRLKTPTKRPDALPALGTTYAQGPARERQTRERSAPSHAQLSVEGRRSAPILIDRDVFLVGAGEGCHLRLTTPRAPRVAAVFVRGQSGWQLVPASDEVTVARTYLTERLWLKDGDRIGVGDVGMVFHASSLAS